MAPNANGKSSAPLMGLVAAVASSLCCITPVLAAFAGVGSLAGSMHWLAPARPWLLGVSALALGYAWWLKMRSAAKDECACDVPVRKSFLQRNGFLVAITAFAVLASSFPLYASLFHETASPVVLDDRANLQRVVLDVKGMSCEGCEQHMSGELRKVPSVQQAVALYTEGSATDEFDPERTSLPALIAAIDSTGYRTNGVIEARLQPAP